MHNKHAEIRGTAKKLATKYVTLAENARISAEIRTRARKCAKNMQNRRRLAVGNPLSAFQQRHEGLGTGSTDDGLLQKTTRSKESRMERSGTECCRHYDWRCTATMLLPLRLALHCDTAAATRAAAATTVLGLLRLVVLLLVLVLLVVLPRRWLITRNHAVAATQVRRRALGTKLCSGSAGQWFLIINHPGHVGDPGTRSKSYCWPPAAALWPRRTGELCLGRRKIRVELLPLIFPLQMSSPRPGF